MHTGPCRAVCFPKDNEKKIQGQLASFTRSHLVAKRSSRIPVPRSSEPLRHRCWPQGPTTWGLLRASCWVLPPLRTGVAGPPYQQLLTTCLQNARPAPRSTPGRGSASVPPKPDVPGEQPVPETPLPRVWWRGGWGALNRNSTHFRLRHDRFTGDGLMGARTTTCPALP